MRHVLETLDERTNAFGKEELFEFMRDTRIPPRQRLSFVPALAHFVMTFADLYALVFREEPARDKYQELVNAHTYEDGGHWKWFLADLGNLGHDPNVAFSDALRFVWSDATTQMRLLSYGLCQLSYRADSLRKLVLVQCIEAAGKVSLKNAALVAKDATTVTGKPLIYFGSHHFDTESDHTLEEEEVQHMLRGVELDPALSQELSSVVDHSFVLFTRFAQELLAFSRSGLRVGE